MNRRELIKFATAAVASSSLAGELQAASRNTETVTLSNNEFELSLTPGAGLLCRLVDRKSGAFLAEGPYFYSPGMPAFGELRRGKDWAEFRGSIPTGISIRHRFSLSSGTSLEEEIELANTGLSPLDLHDLRCGFVLPVPLEKGKAGGPWADYRFTAIPFRREPSGSRAQYTDRSLSEVITEEWASGLWNWDTTVTSAYAAEGWAWTNGTRGFLLSKYGLRGIEFALLDRVALSDGKLGLRWGGCGVYRGNPGHGAWLRPGESHRFGITRLTAYQGDWRQGFYFFRSEMEELGHGCPLGFNPPIHWNELYDNKLWWLPDDQQDDPAMRKKYYTLESMKEEAAKAKEIGCEALYMDPGWDTSFGSKIWDEPRLGTYRSFTAMLAQDYGLRSSLHTPLSGWCDPSSYPVESYVLDRYGDRLSWYHFRGFSGSPICGASEQYIMETARRLKSLARDGAAFFMFDGTVFHFECCDPNHGHPVPARLEEHVQAICRLARIVHEDYPNVLIEMHDPAIGGAPMRGVPIYYGHGHCPEGEQACAASGFDTVWAFELMWMPMDDLLSGRAIALYYYNLAYSLPLYIHIDLRTDNRNALVFWWNASTCRHLGIGGTHPDPAVCQAQKEAMLSYRRLKPFFANGVFYGIDESTHIHTGIEGKSAVMNCFNLDRDPVEREIRFAPAQSGLLPGKSYQFSTGSFRQTGDLYVGKIEIPGHGHTLVEIT